MEELHIHEEEIKSKSEKHHHHRHHHRDHNHHHRHHHRHQLVTHSSVTPTSKPVPPQGLNESGTLSLVHVSMNDSTLTASSSRAQASGPASSHWLGVPGAGEGQASLGGDQDSVHSSPRASEGSMLGSWMSMGGRSSLGSWDWVTQTSGQGKGQGVR
eukprot:156283-Amorphochlora_amoeboformis.AAC.1